MTHLMLKQARRHQLVLKLTMILMIVAVVGLVSAILLKFGNGSWKLIILWFATSLFMLNAFGMNNASALSYLYRVYKKDRTLLTPDELEEVEAELKANQEKLELEPASKTTYIVSGLSLLLLLFGLYRLLTAVGLG